jgi:hypothetical protein
MRELQRLKIKNAIEKGDFGALSRLCLELLQTDNWLEAWRRIEQIIEASGEYVLAKFLASAYVLAQEEIYRVLSPATRDFLARDVVVCLEKTAQVIADLPRQGGSGGAHAQPSA